MIQREVPHTINPGEFYYKYQRNDPSYFNWFYHVPREVEGDMETNANHSNIYTRENDKLNYLSTLYTSAEFTSALFDTLCMVVLPKSIYLYKIIFFIEQWSSTTGPGTAFTSRTSLLWWKNIQNMFFYKVRNELSWNNRGDCGCY